LEDRPEDVSSAAGTNEGWLGNGVWQIVGSISHLLLREWRDEVSEKDSASTRNSNKLVVYLQHARFYVVREKHESPSWTRFRSAGGRDTESNRQILAINLRKPDVAHAALRWSYSE
jgi:hypothetical protein